MPNGRTLCYIGKEFNNFFQQYSEEGRNLRYHEPIYNSLKYFYMNSYLPNNENSELERNNYLNQLKEKFIKPKNDFILGEPPIDEKYRVITNILRDIQFYAVNDSISEKIKNFNFSKICDLIIDIIEFKDLNYIIKHINDTIDLLSKQPKHKAETDNYYQLRILSNSMNDIYKKREFLPDKFNSYNY